MRRRLRRVILLTAAILTGSPVAPAAADDLDRAGDTVAIQQMLVEYVLAERPAWHGRAPEAFCILLGRVEWKAGALVPPDGPSELFLSRILTRGATILPARACEVVSMGINRPGVVTVETRKSAFFVTVSDVVYRSASTAEAHAGFVCGGLCAWGVTFVLQKHEGRWQMISRKDPVIS
jgi:hypothetical protein